VAVLLRLRLHNMMQDIESITEFWRFFMAGVDCHRPSRVVTFFACIRPVLLGTFLFKVPGQGSGKLRLKICRTVLSSK
jgi:hypothetical protein